MIRLVFGSDDALTVGVGLCLFVIVLMGVCLWVVMMI
jgi:hypothetical protein